MTSAAASPHGLRTAHREWPSRAGVVVTVLAGLGVVVSLLVIVGWYARVPELVQFSPADELRVTEEAMRRNMKEMQAV